jgi:hypothetical protein
MRPKKTVTGAHWIAFFISKGSILMTCGNAGVRRTLEKSRRERAGKKRRR